MQIIGDGNIGGKAKGLIFSQLSFEYCAPTDFPRLDKEEYLDLVGFPRSIVLSTDFFDEFMELNNLQNVVYAKCDQEIEMHDMNMKFLESEVPDKLRLAIRDILEMETGPLIIRSSSLLEDNTEHSFAGIYLSIFITNTGTMEEKVTSFVEAVKRVYASTYNANAKAYRKKHTIPWQREKMALLVQNVIGQTHPDSLFYPLFAGVAFSQSYYRWTEKLDPTKGLCRLVVGLGTLAVGRSYARVFSPENPGIRPEGMDAHNILRYSQDSVDVLDMVSGQFMNRPLDAAIKNPHLYKVTSVLKEHNYLMDAPPLLSALDRIVPTFDPLLKNDCHMPFIPIMKNLLKGLENLFGIPVDIEFAVDFETNNDGKEVPKFYLVQVRPLGARPEHSKVSIPEVSKERTLISSHQVLGNAVLENIHHIVYVSPDVFNFQRAFMVAREIGEVNSLLEGSRYILIGPGRWGTSNPQLGVPIHYFEISNASVIVEIATEKFTPEVSYGTHFFGDLVSANILYIPIFQDKGDFLNVDFLEKTPNSIDLRYVKMLEVPDGLKVFADGNSSNALIAFYRKGTGRKLHPKEEEQ